MSKKEKENKKLSVKEEKIMSVVVALGSVVILTLIVLAILFIPMGHNEFILSRYLITTLFPKFEEDIKYFIMNNINYESFISIAAFIILVIGLVINKIADIFDFKDKSDTIWDKIEYFTIKFEIVIKIVAVLLIIGVNIFFNCRPEYVQLKPIVYPILLGALYLPDIIEKLFHHW